MWQKNEFRLTLSLSDVSEIHTKIAHTKNSNVSNPFQSVDISLWAVHIATDESVTESEALNENGRFFIGVFHLIISFVPNTAH